MMEYVGVNVIERCLPKGCKPKMRGRKLRSGVCWQGASKKNGVKRVGLKQDAHVLVVSVAVAEDVHNLC